MVAYVTTIDPKDILQPVYYKKNSSSPRTDPYNYQDSLPYDYKGMVEYYYEYLETIEYLGEAIDSEYNIPDLETLAEYLHVQEEVITGDDGFVYYGDNFQPPEVPRNADEDDEVEDDYRGIGAYVDEGDFGIDMSFDLVGKSGLNDWGEGGSNGCLDGRMFGKIFLFAIVTWILTFVRLML